MRPKAYHTQKRITYAQKGTSVVLARGRGTWAPRWVGTRPWKGPSSSTVPLRRDTWVPEAARRAQSVPSCDCSRLKRYGSRSGEPKRAVSKRKPR
eukprot:742761-Rhodomonas_salina.2